MSKSLLDKYKENLVKVMSKMTPSEFDRYAVARYPHVGESKAITMLTMAIARGEITLKDIQNS